MGSRTIWSNIMPEPAVVTKLSDEEVLSRWVNEPDEDGAITLVVFRRYRVAVRSELEAGGLSPPEAVRMVATVLLHARHARPETTLRDRLLSVAREVAATAKKEDTARVPAPQ
jgi:hypothetical protein